MFNNINIESITIEGFKGYKESKTIQFYDFTKILGDNGQGKTSIGEAITWALLGSNLFGNDKVDNLLLNNNSKKMEVTIKFKDGLKHHVITRSRYGNKTIILLDKKVIKQSELTELLNGKDTFLSIFNPEYFASLSEKNSRDLLISKLPDIDINQILNKMDKYEVDFIKDDLESIHIEPNFYIKTKREEIRESEKDILFNEGVLSKLDIPNEKKELKVFNSSKLEALEKELDNIQLDTIEIDTSKIQSLLDEKHKLEKKIISINSKEFIKMDTSETYKELVELEKDIKILESKTFIIPEEITKKIASLESQIKNLRSEYKEKTKTPIKEGDKCPICRTSIDNTHLEALKKEIGHELSELAKLGKVKGKKLEDLKRSIENDRLDFEKNKVIELNKKQKLYLDLSEKMKRLDMANIENLRKFQENKHNSIVKLQNQIQDIERKIDEFNLTFEKEKETIIKAMNEKRENIKEQILVLRKEKNIVDAHNLEIKLLEEKKDELLNERNHILKENEKINSNIIFYKNQIESAKQYTNLKVRLLSDFIHQYLKDVSIQLQKIVKSTGELRDCFEIKYKGKDFKVLSTSEKIKVGLEMSNLIMSITNLNYPIFIDNAESITKYEISNRQIIEAKVVGGKSITIEENQALPQIAI